MKRNLLILAIVLLIGFIVNSCGGDEENECSICKNGQHCYTHCVNENCPVHDCKNHKKNECSICSPICNLGEHLGIGETCNGINCTLQDYRTSKQKASFPKEINRYGKASNYTDAELRTTADKIIAAFDKIIADANGEIEARDNILPKISKLYVVKAANSHYTWIGTDFGADPSTTVAVIEGRLYGIENGSILPASVASDIIVQLQPANYIRMANGKKQTEQFPVVSNYIDNLIYATVMYKQLKI